MEKHKIGDKIVWKNKNTDTIEKGKIKKYYKDMISIGDHYVSWLLKKEIEIIEKEENNEKKLYKNN